MQWLGVNTQNAKTKFQLSKRKRIIPFKNWQKWEWTNRAWHRRVSDWSLFSVLLDYGQQYVSMPKKLQSFQRWYGGLWYGSLHRGTPATSLRGPTRPQTGNSTWGKGCCAGPRLQLPAPVGLCVSCRSPRSSGWPLLRNWSGCEES